jgi:hypothetical protein
MAHQEIKNNLHQLIDSFDSKTLTIASNMLIELNKHKNVYNKEISDTELQGIISGLSDIEKGNYITLDKFLKTKKQWPTL